MGKRCEDRGRWRHWWGQVLGSEHSPNWPGDHGPRRSVSYSSALKGENASSWVVVRIRGEHTWTWTGWGRYSGGWGAPHAHAHMRCGCLRGKQQSTSFRQINPSVFQGWMTSTRSLTPKLCFPATLVPRRGRKAGVHMRTPSPPWPLLPSGLTTMLPNMQLKWMKQTKGKKLN